jgi:hypothetical protein
MGVKNIENLNNTQLVAELQNGGRFVVYYYTISIVLMTFRQGSDIYFLRAQESPIKFGWKFMFISLVLGWWGFPWGPIYTIQSCYTAFAGKDVTKEIMAQLSRGTSSSEVTYDKKF